MSRTKKSLSYTTGCPGKSCNGKRKAQSGKRKTLSAGRFADNLMTTLLYSGNFGLGHELGTVLRAVHTLNGDTNLRVLLVGNGKGLAETQQLAEELGLANVEFRPPVPLHGLADLLASGDIHLVSQKPRTEGLIVPSKIYGSLAAGRPVIFIGPEHCEVARIVREGGCGFVVAPGDVESTAQALRQLALDSELRQTMGRRARRYYAEKLGRKRSVAQIINVIEDVAGNGQSEHLAGRTSGGERINRPSHRQTKVGPMIGDKPKRKSVLRAVLATSILMLASGLSYRVLATQMRTPLSSTPIAPGALERLPLEIGGWVGQNVPLDEAIIRRTDADALVTRRYSRGDDSKSVELYVACGTRVNELMQHQPDVCYTGAGWRLADYRLVELRINDQVKLPCGIFQFHRTDLTTARIVVLDYFIADGQHYGSISLLRSRVWRVFGSVDYVAQVQIAASCETLSVESATRAVCDFAVDSASLIAGAFQEIGKERRDLRGSPEGR